MVEVELKRWGNSLGVILPSDLLKETGLEQGDTLEVDIVSKKRMNGFGIARGARPFIEEEESHQEF